MTKKGFLTGHIGFTPPRGRALKQDIPAHDPAAQRERIQKALAKQGPATGSNLAGRLKSQDADQD